MSKQKIHELYEKIDYLESELDIEPSNIVVGKKITDTFLKTKFSV